MLHVFFFFKYPTVHNPCKVRIHMLHLKCFGEPLLIRPHSWLENMQTETERPWSFMATSWWGDRQI